MIWLLRKIRLLFYFMILFISLAVVAVIGGAAGILALPDVGILEKCIVTTMYQVHLCPGSSGYVRLHEISPYVLHAVIAAEDGSFYSHKGFDWYEIRQSLNTNMQSGGFRRGGSTLTQQLAKNVFLDREKSLWRKLKEAYLANAIENRYDKNFILEKYLNVVEFDTDLYGVKAAAQHYFHKSPGALHPLEAAYLAMLLPNPKKYSQSARAGHLTPFARKMVQVILQRMQSFGKLSPAAYQTAMASLDAFPWSGLRLSSFAGSPGYDLDSDAKPPAIDEPVTDENVLEELIEEDGRGKSSASPTASDAKEATAPQPTEEAPANGPNSAEEQDSPPTDGK